MNHRLGRAFGLMLVALAAAAVVTVAACAGGGTAARSSPLGNIDQATRTVQLNLIITGSRLNGYSSGKVTVRVPRGWKVDVFCSNQASTPHACAVVSGAESAVPAFSGAASPHTQAGIPAGGFANFTFVATTLGSYRVASLITAGRSRGVWEPFEVVATGRPSVSMSPRRGNEPVAPAM